jgi:DNA-binding ferritin-like protein (Dps family)
MLYVDWYAHLLLNKVLEIFFLQKADIIVIHYIKKKDVTRFIKETMTENHTTLAAQ